MRSVRLRFDKPVVHARALGRKRHPAGGAQCRSAADRLRSSTVRAETDTSPTRDVAALLREEVEHSPSVETAEIELIETLPPVIM